jgi:F-type H+-transporting ATPase subunit epsilon
MAESLLLKVVTPEGSLLDEEVATFTGRSDLGEFCILPQHRPFLASLVAGRMLIEHVNGEKKSYALDKGFLEAGLDHVNVITERCIPAEDLDVAALTGELNALESQMENLDLGSTEAETLLLQLEWIEARLSVAKKQ